MGTPATGGDPARPREGSHPIRPLRWMATPDFYFRSEAGDRTEFRLSGSGLAAARLGRRFSTEGADSKEA